MFLLRGEEKISLYFIMIMICTRPKTIEQTPEEGANADKDEMNLPAPPERCLPKGIRYTGGLILGRNKYESRYVRFFRTAGANNVLFVLRPTE